MKQFSLAGIPLRTIIKSSQSGIAISNHKRDPRRAEPELGPGWGWADVRNAGQDQNLLCPCSGGHQAPRNINTPCSGVHGRGQGGGMGSMETWGAQVRRGEDGPSRGSGAHERF